MDQTFIMPIYFLTLVYAQVYCPSQTFQIDCFANIVNSSQLLALFAKHSISDDW